MGREKLLAQQKAELAQLDADGARKKEEREGALAEKRAERAALGVSAEDKKARAKSELDQVRAEKAAKQEEYDAFVARVQRDEQVTGRHCHHRSSSTTTRHSPLSAHLPPSLLLFQVQYDELGDRVAFLIEHKEQLSTQLRELEQHCENQQQRINDMIQPR